jgi:siderophore synthetase component
MYETQLKAIFRMAPSVGEKGYRRGVDEETVDRMVQSILEEYSARLAPDSDEEVVSLMFQTAIEQVKQLAKQVMI